MKLLIKNKKGVAPAVPAIIWIIFIIIGIIVIKEIGLLFTITPPTGTEGKPNVIINSYYWGEPPNEATNLASWACEQNILIKFRTNDLTYYTSGTSQIAFILEGTTCGTILTPFKKAAVNVDYTGNCDNNMPGASGNPTFQYNVPGDLNFLIDSGTTPIGSAQFWYTPDYAGNPRGYICQNGADGRYYYTQYITMGLTTPIVSTESLSSDISKEVSCGFSPIKDSGKYACSGGNIIMKYCSDFTADNTLEETCDIAQPCQYFSLVTLIGDNPAVKCGGVTYLYKPNRQLCNGDGKSFTQTNADGTDINTNIKCNPDVDYGGTCTQITNDLISMTISCSECSGNIKRCDPLNNLIVQQCYGDGLFHDIDTCTGMEVCQDKLNIGNYTCDSGYTDGQLACGNTYPGTGTNPKQRMIYSSASGTFVNNGAECAGNNICDLQDKTKCTNECNWVSTEDNYGKCENGIVSYCQLDSDVGNIIPQESPHNPKICAYPNYPNNAPACADALDSKTPTTSGAKCFKPYDIGGYYCMNNQIVQGTASTNLLQERGVKTMSGPGYGYDCVFGCFDSTNLYDARCEPLAQCKIANQIVCLPDGKKRGKCNQYLDYVDDAGASDCGATEYCDNSETLANPFANAQCTNFPFECNGTKGCQDGQNIVGCSGTGSGTSATSGYWTGELFKFDDCNYNGCTETVRGQPECTPPPICSGHSYTGTFYACNNETKTSWECISNVSNDWDGKKYVLGSSYSCSPNQCQTTTNPLNKCVSTCTSGEPVCIGDDSWTCVSGNPGTLRWTCQRFTDLGSNPACVGGNCVNECETAGLYACDITKQTYCAQNATTGQKLLEEIECLYGCDIGSGKCVNQCTSPAQCFNGQIYECLLSERTTIILNDCMGLGCSEVIAGQPKCNNGCNPLDESKGIACLSSSDQIVSSCIGSGCKSRICKKNETTNQYYNYSFNCGYSGCGLVSGQYKCLGNIGNANSFVCGGVDNQQIFATDEFGNAVTPGIICSGGGVPPINGLSPYCKDGRENCTYCELGSIYCINSGNSGTTFQCANETSGAIIAPTSCSAGCSQSGGTTYCDSLRVTWSGTTFPTIADSDLGNIDLEITLTGSASYKPLVGKTITVTMSGGQINNLSATTVSSNNEGKILISYKSITKGTYTITVIVNGYTNNIRTIPVVITDLYVISPYEFQTIYLIPGYAPIFKVRVVSSRGGTADGLEISNKSNLTIPNLPIKSNINPELWEITLASNSEPGQYTLGFKPKQGTTTLDEQFVQIEIVKPALTITTNTPNSITPGKKEYRIQVSGPRYDTGILSTGPLKPDVQPKATMTFNSQTKDISLLDQGGGEYLFTYDFVEEGTYSLSIEASKAGYISAKITPLIQVSDSGTEVPPSTDGTGTKTITGGIGGILGGITGGGMSTWFIVGIGVVILYLIITGRKRK